MADTKIRLDYCIVCDDVRIENNGKALLIGVYHGDISVPRFPAYLKLVAFCLGHVEIGGTAVIGLRITDQDGGVLFRSQDVAPSIVQETKPGPFAVNLGSAVVINKPSELEFVVTINEAEYSILKKNVGLLMPQPSAPGV